MVNIKEIYRYLRWFFVLFFLRKHFKDDTVVAEIGVGDSRSVVKAFEKFDFVKRYLLVGLEPIKAYSSSKFFVETLRSNYFDLQEKVDVLVFDHAIDDLLAFMLKTKEQMEYDAMMENIKKFDFQSAHFKMLVKKIFSKARDILAPDGMVLISNYPVKYDKLRGTTEITKGLLPYIRKVTQEASFEVVFSSGRFLVLKVIG